MKKILLNILQILLIVVCITGCKNVIKDDNEKDDNVIFSIESGKKECVPVLLVVYKKRFELYTAYQACREDENCNSMLKYTKSITGTHNYDIFKILENSVLGDNKSYSPDNLPEYEIFTEDEHYYTIEKDQTNKDLDEFLKQIKVDLNVCAEKDYID